MLVKNLLQRKNKSRGTKYHKTNNLKKLNNKLIRKLLKKIHKMNQ